MSQLTLAVDHFTIFQTIQNYTYSSCKLHRVQIKNICWSLCLSFWNHLLLFQIQNPFTWIFLRLIKLTSMELIFQVEYRCVSMRKIFLYQSASYHWAVSIKKFSLSAFWTILNAIFLTKKLILIDKIKSLSCSSFN